MTDLRTQIVRQSSCLLSNFADLLQQNSDFVSVDSSKSRLVMFMTVVKVKPVQETLQSNSGKRRINKRTTCTDSSMQYNSTQLYCKQARGPKRTKKKRKKKSQKNTKTHKYAQRVSHTYKSLRHFANIGERQKRSQLTKSWVISLLHEHSERSSENCCLRTAAKKVIAPCWTNN